VSTAPPRRACELDGVLVPTYALLAFLPAIAALLFALSSPSTCSWRRRIAGG